MRARKQRRIEPYLSRLFGYAISLASDRDRAQELVHECALRALAARRVPADEPAYRAWLFRILRNAFLDQVRREAPERAYSEDEKISDGNQIWRTDDQLINVMTVRAGMNRLAPRHREIIALVDLVGFSYREAAALLGVPEGTVMSRLSRARGALLDQLTEGNVRALPLARGAKAS